MWGLGAGRRSAWSRMLPFTATDIIPWHTSTDQTKVLELVKGPDVED